MADLDTLPKILKRQYERYGDQEISLLEKDFGIYQRYTWKDYYECVKYFSLGLVSLGLQWGDRVCVLGENKPQWYWSELAVQSAGGAVVGIFTDCVPGEVKYFVQNSEATFMISHDQEQTDKCLEIIDEIPLLKKIIYWDPKGLWTYDHPSLIRFDQVIEAGRRYEEAHPGSFEENVARGKGGDIAVFCYTSGTTGLPKGAMMSHRGLIGVARVMLTLQPLTNTDISLAYLPPAWITEQAFISVSLLSGAKVSYPEEPETVRYNLREVAPSVLFLGPKQWEDMSRMTQVRISDSTWFHRFLYNILIPLGHKRAADEIAGKWVSLPWRVLYFISWGILFRPLQDKLGLSRLKFGITGGAGVSPDMIEYFLAMGVKLRQSYGLSELTVISLHRSDDVNPATSGPPTYGTEIRISGEGEVVARNNDMVFSGYYKKPDATRERLDEDGWLHTGDFGHITDEGHLVVLDRIADLRPLGGGRRFTPSYAENRLRFSPFIKEAFVIGGEDKDYAAAMINISFDNVGHWAERRRIPYTTFADLSQKSEVIDLIRNDVEKVNKLIPEEARIVKFVNLHKEFDPDEAELTRTRKVRREFIESHYNELISGLYGGAPEIVVESPILYRDGRRGVIKNVVKVCTVIPIQ
jgi:long-chain acyl-CoA synthetase